MTAGLWYRVMSVGGTAALAGVAIAVANLSLVQETFALVPYFGRPAPDVLAGTDLLLAVMTGIVVVLASVWPLFKPQPRRTLDTVLEAQRRVLIAMVGLAALGYFNYTYRLPRSTLMLSTLILLFALPAFMLAIRRGPDATHRAVLVGDDATAMRSVLDATEYPVVGYIGPSQLSDEQVPLTRLGGLSRISETLVGADADTVLLAFESPDRAEFFGALATCHRHGLAAKIPRDHADSVLTARDTGGHLLTVDIEPWDPQDRLLKRLFDIAFAASALVVLAPVILVVALAIKLDDGGPILYGQERTAEFGGTFQVYKFRTMRPGGEKTTPGSEQDRITRVGRTLRRTHLDEIPQLWAILTGQMSVVGPRATWTDEEPHLEDTAAMWRKRWFVKPGLTGLAQIHGASSTDPEAKLRYDLQYVREQSFWFDIEIVLRQFWAVGVDVWSHLRPSKKQTQSGEPAASGNSPDVPAETSDVTATPDEPEGTDPDIVGDGGRT